MFAEEILYDLID